MVKNPLVIGDLGLIPEMGASQERLHQEDK